MKEVNPNETTRAYAFKMWMNAPMPMLTFFKTLDVTRLVRLSKRQGLKFNMLMCWCIGRAASQVKEFYMLPVPYAPSSPTGTAKSVHATCPSPTTCSNSTPTTCA